MTRLDDALSAAQQRLAEIDRTQALTESVTFAGVAVAYKPALTMLRRATERDAKLLKYALDYGDDPGVFWLAPLLDEYSPRPIEELIEASSLGSPDAVAARESADPALVEKVMQRLRAPAAAVPPTCAVTGDKHLIDCACRPVPVNPTHPNQGET